MDRWSHPAADSAGSACPVGRDRQVLFGQLLSQRLRNGLRDVRQLDRVQGVTLALVKLGFVAVQCEVPVANRVLLILRVVPVRGLIQGDARRRMIGQ